MGCVFLLYYRFMTMLLSIVFSIKKYEAGVKLLYNANKKLLIVIKILSRFLLLFYFYCFIGNNILP